jgi:hypothetical protein
MNEKNVQSWVYSFFAILQTRHTLFVKADFHLHKSWSLNCAISVSTSRWHCCLVELSVVTLLGLHDYAYCACVLCRTLRRTLCNAWETRTRYNPSVCDDISNACYNCLTISSLKWMDLWLNLHCNCVMFQNRDLRSYEKLMLNNKNHCVSCRFISKPCFLFCMTALITLHCTVHDSCTLVWGEYAIWEAIENDLPLSYSKASIYFQ